MKAMTHMPISFPGLFGDWKINPDPIAIDVGSGIYWYGIILAVAMLAGLLLSMKQAKHYGLEEDHIMDLVLWGVPTCIIGARLYYVLFYLDLYRADDGALQWNRMIAIWDGGLAIYGAVIAGALLAFFYARSKKIPFGALTDAAVLGLLLGQAIGRWANFINREAFGAQTDLPWRMEIWLEGLGPTGVHPTFLYESLWNIVGLLMLLFVISKGRRFDGENTCFYFIWYGLGRAWIEGLRTDSLYLFDLAIAGHPIRVSQALSIVVVVVALAVMFKCKKASAEDLWVNKVALAKAAAEAEAAAETEVEAPSVEEVIVEETVSQQTEAQPAEEAADGDQN
ncbi:MAG: prolipoprotein diacylglyceryl transferase [Ruminococcaceae bacterium]|nr:prolipoprotein diacylglyceryl transferase [Oscillospiraceae bacterium]